MKYFLIELLIQFILEIFKYIIENLLLWQNECLRVNWHNKNKNTPFPDYKLPFRLNR